MAFYTVTTKGCNNNHVANNRIEKCSNCVVKVNDRGSTGNVIELNTFVTTKTILNSGTGTVITGATRSSREGIGHNAPYSTPTGQ